ncbi:MAG TPA: hypothetical protein IAD15_04795 [Candidatus Fimiplasma intestinipullorum]|uniref:Uncharacterized protein n=1 Tax=Candidatus Fimiplasma intestinipullorum TaxID=2840825 RepID=A0A9D1HPZ6_9FIRM|nr:hypothetical protein [Candidatus Fimiplasma intestinipullorum]
MNKDPISYGDFSPFWFWFFVFGIPILYVIFVIAILWYKNNYTNLKFSKNGWDQSIWHWEVIGVASSALYGLIYHFFQDSQYLPASGNLFHVIKDTEMYLIIAIDISFPIIDMIILRRKYLKKMKEADHS